MRISVLVTGATGFLGRHLIPELGFCESIHCLVRKTSNVSSIQNKNVEFFYGDITDKATLQKAMQGVDTVIHMAAECNSKKTDLMYSANVEGTKRIVEVCKALSINKLIYLSSVAVVFEDKCSHDKYCSTKKQAEEIVLNSQLNSVILRPSAIYPSKGGFAMPVKLARYFPVIPLPEFTWRRRLQQPVYIENVIEVILKALQSDQAKTNKPYFVAGPNTQTIEELVDRNTVFPFKPIKIKIPSILIKLLRVLGITAGQSFLSENRNCYSFDITETEKDFNYRPLDICSALKTN